MGAIKKSGPKTNTLTFVTLSFPFCDLWNAFQTILKFLDNGGHNELSPQSQHLEQQTFCCIQTSCEILIWFLWQPQAFGIDSNRRGSYRAESDRVVCFSTCAPFMQLCGVSQGLECHTPVGKIHNPCGHHCGKNAQITYGSLGSCGFESNVLGHRCCILADRGCILALLGCILANRVCTFHTDFMIFVELLLTILKFLRGGCHKKVRPKNQYFDFLQPFHVHFVICVAKGWNGTPLKARLTTLVGTNVLEMHK